MADEVELVEAAPERVTPPAVRVADEVAVLTELTAALACWVCEAVAVVVEVELLAAVAVWVCKATEVVVLTELTEALTLNDPLAIAVVEDVDDVVAAPETITGWTW